MTANYVASKGTTLTFGGAWAEVLKISGPNATKETIETTTLADDYETCAGGIVNGGELDFDLALTAANYSTLQGLLPTEAPAACTVTWSDSTSQSFLGLLTEVKPTYERKNRVEASCKIKVSGNPFSAS